MEISPGLASTQSVAKAISLPYSPGPTATSPKEKRSASSSQTIIFIPSRSTFSQGDRQRLYIPTQSKCYPHSQECSPILWSQHEINIKEQ